jgi:hypothetical protein
VTKLWQLGILDPFLQRAVKDIQAIESNLLTAARLTGTDYDILRQRFVATMDNSNRSPVSLSKVVKDYAAMTGGLPEWLTEVPMT